MASILMLLLQLLLVSLVSASHHLGGSTTFTSKGRNPDGTFSVEIRSRDTFSLCPYYIYRSWYCYTGNCGSQVTGQSGTIDNGINAPTPTRQWCTTETVHTWNVPSDQPFQIRSASCCWIPTRNGVVSWRLLTSVDLGTRSDTGKPNRSPRVASLPLLRVPQNCPRTYNLTAVDPDDDKVRCRYGNIRHTECSTCDQPSGFRLDEDTCTLHYYYSRADSRIYGFEMVVEDFPQRSIRLSYTDGSMSIRAPLAVRRKRQAYHSYQTTIPPYLQTTNPWLWWHSTSTPTPTGQSTTTPTATTTRTRRTTNPWLGWHSTSTPTPTGQSTTTPTVTTTTRRRTTNPWPGWHSTSIPTTTRQPIITTSTPTTRTTFTMPTPHAVTLPLSKVPLHFSFLVDPPVPSCQEGLYLPKLVHPTPRNGELFKAEVYKEMEIRVKAQATNSVFNNVIINGPLNISKHRTTHDEFVIRWTPHDLGGHVPICFAAESVSGYSVYQSEMRCVVVDVIKDQVKSTVICSESTMTIVIEKSSIPGLNESHLKLNDPTNMACSLRSNSTDIFAVVPLSLCGTQIEEDNDNLLFKNEISLVDNPKDVITRKNLLEVQFSCQYPKRGNVSMGFTIHRKSITVMEKGFGTFTYQFEFFPNNRYQRMIDPNSYPLDYDIGNQIYMQIEATSSVNNTELFVESCRAAPYDNPNYQTTYAIIDNGCKVDSTVQIYTPAKKTQFQFSMEAFKFIGLFDQVYISCSVLICEAGNPETRCSQGCIRSSNSGSWSNNRKKRAAITQSSVHLVSQGPLRLRRSADLTRSPETNLNLNLVFMAGCVLAAVGIIGAVVMYKAKVSKIKYQRLPTSES